MSLPFDPHAPYGDPADHRSADATGVRPPYRPPVGLPARETQRWRGTAASVAFHVLLLLLLATPFLASDDMRATITGAGGAGPAGGGGGGNRGTGSDRITERLQYVQVAPTPAPTAVPAVVPPVVPPVVKPPVVKPVTPPKPQVTAPAPVPVPEAAAPAASVSAGTGGGSGTDGSQGNGPGTGGGVGSGEGTGRGTGNGPGTGGGPGMVYHPVLTVTLLPPQPVPRSVKGSVIVANFDVDEKGNVLSVQFTETRDGGYNRKLRDTFRELRFRPATRADGTPVRDTAQVTYTVY